MKQVWVILKNMDMRHAKPYPHVKIKPEDRENILKNSGKVSMDETVIGFLDENAPQTTANTVRL
jgi:hypothetical protein